MRKEKNIESSESGNTSEEKKCIFLVLAIRTAVALSYSKNKTSLLNDWMTQNLIYEELCADTPNAFSLLTHYRTVPHSDALKIYSCGKHCEKRRNCL